ncbi:MAG: PilZ domain-containing protein [Planctomycetota bacterium]|nr:PilZ domain-containing protein [Planctomycetota bacterium]
MHSCRRAQYRVKVDAAAGLVATMHNPGGSPFVGRMVDTSACGVGVCFPQPNWPNLTLGQEIDLVFTSEKFNEPLRVAVRVQHRTEEAGARRYGFRFLHPEQLDAHLCLTFRQYFNRRKMLRVIPDPDDLVRVTLAAGQGEPPVEVRLENFSAIGAAVSLEAELDAAFVETTRVGFSIQLPNCRCCVYLIGSIRYRRLVGARIHYGIEFDPELSEDFGRQQDIINKYTTKREQQWLRRSA